MAFGLNRVEPIGRLGADVTVNHLTNGAAIPANAVGLAVEPGLGWFEGVTPLTGEAVPAGSMPDALRG